MVRCWTTVLGYFGQNGELAGNTVGVRIPLLALPVVRVLRFFSLRSASRRVAERHAEVEPRHGHPLTEIEPVSAVSLDAGVEGEALTASLACAVVHMEEQRSSKAP